MERPQPSSLSLSFLPLCQSVPVSSPSEVSTPSEVSIPILCAQTRLLLCCQDTGPVDPKLCGRQYQSSACKSTERKGLGCSSPLQSFAGLRGAMSPHKNSTIFLLLLLRRMPSLWLLTQSKSRDPEEVRPAATEGHCHPESFPLPRSGDRMGEQGQHRKCYMGKPRVGAQEPLPSHSRLIKAPVQSGAFHGPKGKCIHTRLLGVKDAGQ